jgi:hypothetical protein
LCMTNGEPEPVGTAGNSADEAGEHYQWRCLTRNGALSDKSLLWTRCIV